MTETFDGLYEKSQNGVTLDKLYDIITSRENILLAFRSIKSNRGSMTAGADGRTINAYKNLTDVELVTFIQKRLENYRPMKVRRVYIPKPNGNNRPLGIPSMSDRIIQQAFKQVLEPICEAKFYNHSYGFRPLRSTHHAIARVNSLINKANLHYAVDIDIKGFFDNVNHTLLIKQMWNIGIKDRKVLTIISKMLKAEIVGEGIPTKGTPQGGILSPLLSNIVLNDLDNWVAGQWETFESDFKYSQNYSKYTAFRKNSNLKEGFIVRYADDFKILCRDHKTAQKWYLAVKHYLKDRLKLDISPVKSKVINLRKSKSEFLGFTFKAVAKGKRFVAISHVSDAKIEQHVEEGRKNLKLLQQNPSPRNAMLYNSWVLGIHHYSKTATHVVKDFNIIAFRLLKTHRSRLIRVSKYQYPKKAPLSYTKYYRTTYKTYRFGDVFLFPLADIKHMSSMNFSQESTLFTKDGRNKIHTNLKGDVAAEIRKLMKSNIPNRSANYFDNRISRYSMKNGKCEITGEFLSAEYVHCHHYLPIHLGGLDDFENLRILNKFVHILVHATDCQTINKYLQLLKLNDEAVKKINVYRKKCNLESIS